MKKVGDLVNYDCRSGDIISFFEGDYDSHWQVWSTYPQCVLLVKVGSLPDECRAAERAFVTYQRLSQLGAKYEYCRPIAPLPRLEGLA